MSRERRIGWVPQEYNEMSLEELGQRVAFAKAELGSRLTILGHHYQRDEIIRYADYRGDSLELSRRAASTDSEYIVFCGVNFMAETAAVLCSPEQIVIQPVEEALCPMAEMAGRHQAETTYEALANVWSDRVIPITYQNSTAEIKAFVGEQGGAVCTSSNARGLFEWAFDQGGRILFLPDEHLGTNTALDMGLPEEALGVWDPLHPPDPAQFADCRVVVWKGFCWVHTGFATEDVAQARAQYPDALVIVHPECPRPVVVASDTSGSTARIIQVVEQASPGATIIVGTECHLVDRLNDEHPDKLVLPLTRRACGSMALTQLKHLTYVLDGLLEGETYNVVQVPEDVARSARLALDKMLQIG
jgi:quinolinate synthase